MGFQDPHSGRVIMVIVSNINMQYFSYVIVRDYGFAPNPFGIHCTLATCKPKIRRVAQVGDWIFGISPRCGIIGNDLICAMKVSQKITYNDYWNSIDFQYKKPLMNGSLKQMYGDNIYHSDNDGVWYQANSHHSYEDGSINFNNLNRDKEGMYVLISEIFYYFGGYPLEIPFGMKNDFSVGIGHRRVNEESALKLINWLENNCEKGFHNDPLLFVGFKRYNGVN